MDDLIRGMWRQEQERRNNLLRALFGPVPPPRRKIFVSYHHAGDQAYYNHFSHVFHVGFEAVMDRSLREAYDSDDLEYVFRQVRENNISYTSCTLVLCGRNTPGRKFVDWEIKATLDKQHALIAVYLDSSLAPNGRFTVPDRLYENLASGYAVQVRWSELMNQPSYLTNLIEIARSRPVRSIVNSPFKMTRNRPLI